VNLDLLSGRFAELSSEGETASLSAAVSIILEAQERGEPAAWVTAGRRLFPSRCRRLGRRSRLASRGPRRRPDVGRACGGLASSFGAFGVVVLDLGADSEMQIPVQARLAGLAKKTPDGAPLYDEEAARRRVDRLARLAPRRGACEKNRFRQIPLEVRVLKDKRRGPGWSYEEEGRGVEGCADGARRCVTRSRPPRIEFRSGDGVLDPPPKSLHIPRAPHGWSRD